MLLNAGTGLDLGARAALALGLGGGKGGGADGQGDEGGDGDDHGLFHNSSPYLLLGVEVNVSGYDYLLYAGSGLDLGAGPALALRLGGGESGGAE